MYEGKSIIIFFNKLLRSFSAFFTFVIFLRLFIKLVSDYYYQLFHGIYSHESISLTSRAILEVAAFALILAVINIVILSDIFLFKMRFLLRSFLFYITTLSLTTVFAIFLDWLQINSILAWASFFIIFTICFAIGIGIKLLKAKFDNRKYNELLERYKSKFNTH